MRPSSVCFLVLIWGYSQVTQAYTKFKPECTNPNATVNFVASPPTRGTLDILWSSLFTIFACTWTILHLNVPEQRDGRDPGRRGDLKWKWKAIWDKGKWMVGTIIIPEYLLVYAVARFFDAWERHPQIKALADEDRVPWTLAHTTLANMGGFIVQGSLSPASKDPGPEISAIHIQSETTKRASTSVGAKEWYILDLDTIMELRSEGHIVLPCIPTAEIDDHSKGDMLTKGITTVQIMWSIANAITRVIRGLAISQLEISVIAFSVCALLIYACYWHSPKDVAVPIKFLEWGGPIPFTIREIVKKTNPDRIMTNSNAQAGRKPLKNTFSNRNKIWLDEVTYSVGFPAFGAPHLLAWNFVFPTSAERIIWRSASLFCSSIGLILVVFVSLPEQLAKNRIYGSLRKLLDSYIQYVVAIAMVTYILARLFLIVESFRTLLFLPPSAYVATWTSSVPMFG